MRMALRGCELALKVRERWRDGGGFCVSVCVCVLGKGSVCVGGGCVVMMGLTLQCNLSCPPMRMVLGGCELALKVREGRCGFCVCVCGCVCVCVCE
jgi:hypothetical protein